MDEQEHNVLQICEWCHMKCSSLISYFLWGFPLEKHRLLHFLHTKVKILLLPKCADLYFRIAYLTTHIHLLLCWTLVEVSVFKSFWETNQELSFYSLLYYCAIKIIYHCLCCSEISVNTMNEMLQFTTISYLSYLLNKLQSCVLKTWSMEFYG